MNYKHFWGPFRTAALGLSMDFIPISRLSSNDFDFQTYYGYNISNIVFGFAFSFVWCLQYVYNTPDACGGPGILLIIININKKPPRNNDVRTFPRKIRFSTNRVSGEGKYFTHLYVQYNIWLT